MNVETAFRRHYCASWGEQSDSPRTASVRDAQKSLIERHITDAITRFSAAGLTAEGLTPYFVEDARSANGHAFFDGVSFRPWFSVDEDWSEDGARIFSAHELAHAIHYRYHPEFYFSNRAERAIIGRQIITEGLATFATELLLHVDRASALWADYLSRNDVAEWMRGCETNLRRFAIAALREWHQANDRPFTYTGLPDPWQNRGGYYLGACVVARIQASQRIELQSLFELDRSTFEMLARGELEVIASGE